MCYENCKIVDDDRKSRCLVMENGKCKICFGKCIWLDYKNMLYIYRYFVEMVKKIYIEMK